MTNVNQNPSLVEYLCSKKKIMPKSISTMYTVKVLFSTINIFTIGH